jgi:hypothetical protein
MNINYTVYYKNSFMINFNCEYPLLMFYVYSAIIKVTHDYDGREKNR